MERYAAVVAAKLPSVAKKRAGPHTIRRTTATHLLRSGVDIITIRRLVGADLPEHDERLRRSGSGDEDQSSSDLRGEGGKAPGAAAGKQGADGVLEDTIKGRSQAVSAMHDVPWPCLTITHSRRDFAKTHAGMPNATSPRNIHASMPQIDAITVPRRNLTIGSRIRMLTSAECHPPVSLDSRIRPRYE